MSQVASETFQIASEDADRAILYGFIGRVLQGAPDAGDLAVICDLQTDGSPLGRALAAVAQAAGEATPEDLARAYQDLFIGLGRGEFLPYGSYYLTGFLHEKPLADLRASMARFGIERVDGVSEPEDHIAAVMQMMEGLIMGDFGQVATLEEQRQFFSSHVGSWTGHFFKDLAATETDGFYAAVGELGRVFMAVEADGFAMTH